MNIIYINLPNLKNALGYSNIVIVTTDKFKISELNIKVVLFDIKKQIMPKRNIVDDERKVEPPQSLIF